MRRCSASLASRRAVLRSLLGLAGVSSAGSLLPGCGGGGSASESASPQPEAAPQASESAEVSAARPVVRTLNTSLASPWGMAFLPDGRMLVTQKAGSMVIVSADGMTVETTVSGVPAALNEGQGGLLDVAIDPDFAIDPWVYWTYSEAGGSGTSGTAVARGRLAGSALTGVAVIFRQQPKVVSSGHYGSRLAFRSDRTLLVTLGERMLDDPSDPGVENAQNLSKHLGKIVRIHRDGSVPADNPFIGTAGALPEIWSYGHRNPQGAAIDAATGRLWITEHGPQGGDELNLIARGGNYGWPLRSYGCPYGSPAGGGCRVARGAPHAPDFVEPVSSWAPLSIAPTGLIVYRGKRFAQWQGSALIGALQPGTGTSRALWRVALAGAVETGREALFGSLDERIRCVREGPDGWVYLLTDSGKLIRIEI